MSNLVIYGLIPMVLIILVLGIINSNKIKELKNTTGNNNGTINLNDNNTLRNEIQTMINSRAATLQTTINTKMTADISAAEQRAIAQSRTIVNNSDGEAVATIRNATRSELGYEFDMNSHDLILNKTLNNKEWDGMIMPFYFDDIIVDSGTRHVTQENLYLKADAMKAKHWYICDGQEEVKNGVRRRKPDLRGRFILGAGHLNRDNPRDRIENASGRGGYFNGGTPSNNLKPYDHIFNNHENIYFDQGQTGGTSSVQLHTHDLPDHNHVTTTSSEAGLHHGHLRMGTGSEGRNASETVTSARHTDTTHGKKEFNLAMNYEFEPNGNYYNDHAYRNVTLGLGNHTHTVDGGNLNSVNKHWAHNNMPPYGVYAYFIYWPGPWKITSAQCAAQGGTGFNVCSSTGVTYCCDACTGTHSCPNDDGLLNCACV